MSRKTTQQRHDRRNYDMRFLGEHEHLLSMVRSPGQQQAWNSDDPIQRMRDERSRNRELAGRRILESQYFYLDN